MGNYTAQDHGEDGSAVTFGAVAESGDTARLDGVRRVLRWKNSGAGSHVATIQGSGLDCNGLPNPDLAITIPNGSVEITSPVLRPERFGNPATVTYDSGSEGEITAALVIMNDDKGLS